MGRLGRALGAHHGASLAHPFSDPCVDAIHERIEWRAPSVTRASAALCPAASVSVASVSVADFAAAPVCAGTGGGDAAGAPPSPPSPPPGDEVAHPARHPKSVARNVFAARLVQRVSIYRELRRMHSGGSVVPCDEWRSPLPPVSHRRIVTWGDARPRHGHGASKMCVSASIARQSVASVFVDLPPVPMDNTSAPRTARRLDRALQHHARAHRDLRRDPAPCRRPLQGLGMATPVGTTRGRGRYNRHTRRSQPKKDIRLRSLRIGLRNCHRWGGRFGARQRGRRLRRHRGRGRGGVNQVFAAEERSADGQDCAASR